MGGVRVWISAAEAMSQLPGPPHRRSPHKSPSPRTGAQLGGARWVALAMKAAKNEERARSRGERCDRFPGAADARRSTPHLEGRRPCGRRDTKRMRLARWSSRPEHI